jgi:hybrid cluster-associated redox disulfide protein
MIAMITKELTINKIIKNYPEKIEILMEFGMDCIGCLSAKFETLEQASVVHGFDLEELLYELNR